MKRILFLSLLGLSACQEINSMNFCGLGSGIERFETCSLDKIIFSSNSPLQQSFYDEIKKEYGSRGASQVYLIETAWFGTLINGSYFPGEENNLREIKEKSGIDSFSRIGELVKKCDTFNEHKYRNKLQLQYGRVGKEKVEKQIADENGKCDYLRDPQSPLYNAKYYIGLVKRHLNTLN